MLCYFDHFVSQLVVSMGKGQKNAEINHVSEQTKREISLEAKSPAPPSSLGTWYGPGHLPVIPEIFTEPTEQSSGADAHIYGYSVYNKGEFAAPRGKMTHAYFRAKLDVHIKKKLIVTPTSDHTQKSILGGM